MTEHSYHAGDLLQPPIVGDTTADHERDVEAGPGIVRLQSKRWRR